MNWADWTIVAIVGVSALLSLWRGFIKEALSLVIWVAAFIVSTMFSDSLAFMLSDIITTPSLRRIVAMALLFAGTLMVGGLLNFLIGQLVKMSGLSGTDRLLGMVFGIARGVIVVVVILMFLPPILHVDQDPWWQSSSLIPHFQVLEGWSKQTGAEVVGWLRSFIS
jgi:membrane protein required for colicin V production